jgi:hypothetical protein
MLLSDKMLLLPPCPPLCNPTSISHKSLFYYFATNLANNTRTAPLSHPSAPRNVLLIEIHLFQLPVATTSLLLLLTGYSGKGLQANLLLNESVRFS